MADIDKLLTQLSRDGLLLQQDKRLPSVVGLLVGSPLAGSWWSHPKAHVIFHCLEQLLEHPDVLVTRLVGGKVTYLHRSLWPAFLAVATAQEAWQRRRLSPGARKLLREIEAEKEAQATGTTAKELQERLLVYAEEVHTEAGSHQVLLRPWSTVERRIGPLPQVPAAEGREQLERAALALGAKAASLPWRRFARGGRKDNPRANGP
jgi:hypothetical protein